jgi:hypothetical protein
VRVGVGGTSLVTRFRFSVQVLLVSESVEVRGRAGAAEDRWMPWFGQDGVARRRESVGVRG